jgi:hypothetical protein
MEPGIPGRRLGKWIIVPAGGAQIAGQSTGSSSVESRILGPGCVAETLATLTLAEERGMTRFSDAEEVVAIAEDVLLGTAGKSSTCIEETVPSPAEVRRISCMNQRQGAAPVLLCAASWTHCI